jgi:hypothetical protein
MLRRNSIYIYYIMSTVESEPKPEGSEGFEVPKLLGGKRSKKQQQKELQEGGALAFSELKGGRRSKKQQKTDLQEGGALAFSELKALKGGRRSKKQQPEMMGGSALSPATVGGADHTPPSTLGGLKQAGGKGTSRKRRSAKKSHRRRSSKRTTVKSMVKGLFGIFKKK